MNINEIKVGTVLMESWNGMAEFYEVIKKTEKSVTVVQLVWDTTTPPENGAVDTAHNWVAIKRDGDGKFVRQVGKNTFTKKFINVKGENGSVKGITYNGTWLHICENPLSKFRFYWG